MEATALTHAHKRGLFARPSPFLRMQGDERLVALTRRGNQAAFETLVGRYQPRLLGFCRQMLVCTEDAEDVLQEVFVAAYNAMIADERALAVRPWLYRIARNRCLNHLRKPVPDGQDTMDVHPIENGASTHDRVQNREEFRHLLVDVGKLPETQRSALLLREIDAMSYEEIAQAMDTTVPGVKSLLVRARIALAEASQARQLTCGEVRLELAEAAEGLAKASGPVRRHVRSCDGCKEFRDQLRTDKKALAALFPVPLLVLIKSFVVGKLGGGAAGGAAGGTAGASGAAGGASAAGAGAAGSAGAVGATGAAGAVGATGAAGTVGAAGAAGGTAAASGAAAAGAAASGAAAAGGAAAGGVGAAIGSKAAVGLATATLLTAGAAEVKHVTTNDPKPKAAEEKVAPVAPATPTTDPAAANQAPAGQNEKVVEPVPAEGTQPCLAHRPSATAPTQPATTSPVCATVPHKGRKGKKRKALTGSGNTQPGGASVGISGGGSDTESSGSGGDPPPAEQPPVDTTTGGVTAP